MRQNAYNEDGPNSPILENPHFAGRSISSEFFFNFLPGLDFFLTALECILIVLQVYVDNRKRQVTENLRRTKPGPLLSEYFRISKRNSRIRVGDFRTG